MDVNARLIKILPNITKMLVDRGYSSGLLPSTEYTNLLQFKINSFFRKDDDSSRILDFFADSGDQRDYVYFTKDIKSDGKLNKNFFKRLLKISNNLELTKGLNINTDNISFVLVNKYITPVEKELIFNFESKNPYIRVFGYKKFSFNLTDHYLVPKHRKYTDSYKSLFTKLMIQTIDQLPYILYTDPMSRHLNLRDDDIVQITRKTLGKDTTAYRVCKNFNYLHMAAINKDEKQVKSTSKKYKQKFEIDNPQEESETMVKKDVSLKIKFKIKKNLVNGIFLKI